MRTRAVLTGIFASIGVIVIGWQVGGVAAQGGVATTSGGTRTVTTTGGSTTTAGTSGTYTGDVESTRFGNVQVEVTITDGAITDVTPLQLTDAEGRSVQISNRAAPILRSEVLASQSAAVSNVSGATYTSDAYLASLQSALDQADLS